MDYCLQTHGAKYTCSVPDGMRELMMDISREVLRSQPTFIYSFIADYLDALLITREHARVATRVVNCFDDAGASLSDLLIRAGMTPEQSELTVDIIRHTFNAYSRDRARGLSIHLIKHDYYIFTTTAAKLQEFEILQRIIKETDISAAQAVKAAVIIQSAFKSFRLQQLDQAEVSSDGAINWQKAAIRTTDIYEQTKPTKQLLNRAASLIQVAYRAYYKRKNLKNQGVTECLYSENCLCTMKTCQPGACECISKMDKLKRQEAEHSEYPKNMLKELSSELFLCDIKRDRKTTKRSKSRVKERVKITIPEKEYTETVYEQLPEEIQDTNDDDSTVTTSEYSRDFESDRTVESVFEEDFEDSFSNKSQFSDEVPVLTSGNDVLLMEAEFVELYPEESAMEEESEGGNQK